MKTIRTIQPVLKPLEALVVFTKTNKVEPSSTTCSIHGETEWDGHIACGECGNLFETRVPAQFDRLAPRQCQCGYRLLPHDNLAFTAKICCSDCWKTAMATWRASKSA